MRVEIAGGLDQADSLKGTVVVLDIFRASNTIIALLAGGARRVWLLADLERARALRAHDPSLKLLGERGGVMPPDFDGDNSPTRAPAAVVPGGEAVLTTSAGTQAIHRLQGARRVLFASFANAGAVTRYLRAQGPDLVSLLPMGKEAVRPALEDDLCAQYLAGALAGEPPDFAAMRPRLLDCDGAARLRRLGQEDDLDLCTRLDSQDLVPVVGYDGEPYAALPGA